MKISCLKMRRKSLSFTCKILVFTEVASVGISNTLLCVTRAIIMLLETGVGRSPGHELLTLIDQSYPSVFKSDCKNKLKIKVWTENKYRPILQNSIVFAIRIFHSVVYTRGRFNLLKLAHANWKHLALNFNTIDLFRLTSIAKHKDARPVSC